jgi:hypothetical protein
MSFTYSALASIFHEHSIIMIVSILSVAFTIGLKTLKMFLVELCVLLILISSYFIDGALVHISSLFIAAIQIALFLFFLYKIKRAVYYEYTLVIEKTHEIPRKITKEGNLGTKRSFF